jgi:hypothetical protein
MKYIVMSPGRTGATLIVNNLNSQGQGDIAYVEHRPPMIPTLDNRFQAQNKLKFPAAEITPILSRRHCVFDAVISLAIMSNTNEAQDYTDTQYSSFVFPKQRFISNYLYYLNFYDQLDLSLYQYDPITLYFEDIMEDNLYLFRSIGLEKETDYNLCKKSPHRHNLVTNLDELIEVCKKQRWPIPTNV